MHFIFILSFVSFFFVAFYVFFPYFLVFSGLSWSPRMHCPGCPVLLLGSFKFSSLSKLQLVSFYLGIYAMSSKRV